MKLNDYNKKRKKDRHYVRFSFSVLLICIFESPPKTSFFKNMKNRDISDGTHTMNKRICSTI
jgi:hypothetical protein